MFHNMGPEPAPRSGHGMVAVGTKVYVLGGVSEDNLDETGKDANVAYVLDTSAYFFSLTALTARSVHTVLDADGFLPCWQI